MEIQDFCAQLLNINLLGLGAVPDDVSRIVNALKGEMQSDGSPKSWKLTVMNCSEALSMSSGSGPEPTTLEECLHSLGVGRRDECADDQPKLSSDSKAEELMLIGETSSHDNLQWGACLSGDPEHRSPIDRHSQQIQTHGSRRSRRPCPDSSPTRAPA